MGLDFLKGMLPSWAQSIDISKYLSQVLGTASQGGANNSLFLMFLMFVAMTFLRRIAFFSIASLMPLGLLGGLFYFGAGKAKGAVSTLPALPNSTGSLSPLAVCLLVVAGLYLLGRFRFVSLGSALALMVIGLVLSGHTPQLPARFESASSSELLVAVAGLAFALLFLRTLWQRMYRFVPISAGPGYPVTYMPVSPFARHPLLLMLLRVAALCAALACLSVLYFWPEIPQLYLVWWKAEYSPYAFVLSLLSIPFLLQGSRFVWPKMVLPKLPKARPNSFAAPASGLSTQSNPVPAPPFPGEQRLDMDLGRLR